LVIAGTTAGVLDADGVTIARLDRAAMARLLADGTATAGMVAKLRACEDALDEGVDDVVIVDGRESAGLVQAASDAMPPGATRICGNEPGD